MSYNGERYVLPKWNYKFNLIPKSRLKPFTQRFNYDEGLVRGEPGGFVLTAQYARHAQDIYRFQPRKDDIWIVTFPKCGTKPT